MLAKYFKNYVFILAVMFTALISTSVVVLIGFVNYFADQHQENLLDKELADIFGKVLIRSPEEISTRQLIFNYQLEVENRIDNPNPAKPYVYMLVDYSRNQLLAGSLTQVPKINFDDEGRGDFSVYHRDVLNDEDEIHNYIGRAVNISNTGTDKVFLLVGRNVNQAQVLSSFNFQLLAIIVMVLLAIAGALLFSKLISRRQENFNATCQSIIAGGDLSRRIQLNNSGDQFDKMASNVNGMLERIQHHVENNAMLTHTLAHELGKPLTRLVSNLEVIRESIEDANENEENSDRIHAAIEESYNLKEMFRALNEISRVKSDELRVEGIDLTELIARNQLMVEEDYGPIAEDKSLNIHVDDESFSSTTIDASRTHLELALGNLVVNAIKYTPVYGSIEISGETHPDGFNFVISNTGYGIPVEHRMEVRAPFVRYNQDKVEDGRGIGLSLVSEIAKRHGVELKLEDNLPSEEQPGLKVTLGPFPFATT